MSVTAQPKRVLIVAPGDTEAAAQVFKAYDVATWNGSGPTGYDWSATEGRAVDMWFPATTEGREQAAAIAAKVLANAASVRIVNTTEAQDGWTITQALADGLTPKDIRAWGRERIKDVSLPAPPPSVPRETSKAVRKAAGSEPTSDGTPAYVLWEQLGLARNERGPYATEANALRIISAHHAYAGRIWLDEFAQRLMIDTDSGARQFTKTDALQCLAWMQESLQLPKMPLAAVTHASILMGERNKRHELRDWLLGLQWDGVGRLETLLADGWGADQSNYTAAVGRCWLVGMVSRIFAPGEKMDTLPVFNGEQGIFKSTSLMALMPHRKYFLSSNIDPVRNQKDFLGSLQGKWLIEFAEINRYVSRESHADDMKALISIESDTYRVPYGATTMDYPRQCVFSGSCNTDEWIMDQTGGRRFWPVQCGQISVDYITSNRDQLFAEAVHRYNAGQAWWDVPNADARREQESRRIKDAWEELILRYVDEGVDRSQPGPAQWWSRAKPLEIITVMDILTGCLGIPEGRCDRSLQMRVASCLKTLGFEKHRLGVGEKRFNGYKPPIKVTV